MKNAKMNLGKLEVRSFVTIEKIKGGGNTKQRPKCTRCDSGCGINPTFITEYPCV